MSNLEHLLRRYGEGNLSPEELAELNQLTRRDQVLASARQQANAIHRRRYGVVGMVAVLAVTGTVFFLHPSADKNIAEMPVVAQTEAPRLTEPVAEPLLKANGTNKTVSVQTTRQHDTAIIMPKSTPISSKPVEQPVDVEAVVEQMEPATIVDETIVACNTDCSPDSVINDIWKFLRT